MEWRRLGIVDVKAYKNISHYPCYFIPFFHIIHTKKDKYFTFPILITKITKNQESSSWTSFLLIAKALQWSSVMKMHDTNLPHWKKSKILDLAISGCWTNISKITALATLQLFWESVRNYASCSQHSGIPKNKIWKTLIILQITFRDKPISTCFFAQ